MRSHGIYRDVQMVIHRLGIGRRGREIGEGRTSTPRIRHMLLLPPLLLLLLLPAFDNNYAHASRNPL